MEWFEFSLKIITILGMSLFIIMMCFVVVLGFLRMFHREHAKNCKTFEDMDKCIKDINKLIDSITEDRNKK